MVLMCYSDDRIVVVLARRATIAANAAVPVFAEKSILTQMSTRDIAARRTEDDKTKPNS